jgi:hypothetical protein
MGAEAPGTQVRDLAAIVAALHTLGTGDTSAPQPERLQSGWHRSSRRLPN